MSCVSVSVNFQRECECHVKLMLLGINDVLQLSQSLRSLVLVRLVVRLGLVCSSELTAQSGCTVNTA